MEFICSGVIGWANSTVGQELRTGCMANTAVLNGRDDRLMSVFPDDIANTFHSHDRK